MREAKRLVSGIKIIVILMATGLIYLSLGMPVIHAQANESVPEKAELVNPIDVGEEIPNTEILDLEGNKVNLKDHLQGKKVVLIVYRGGWCPYCTAHLKELQRIEPELKAKDYEIVGMSADNPAHAFMTLDKKNLSYTLLSDPTMSAAKAMGLAFHRDDESVRKGKFWGFDIEEASGYDHHILPVPAVFILDETGVIRYRFYDPNYRKRLSAKEILEATN